MTNVIHAIYPVTMSPNSIPDSIFNINIGSSNIKYADTSAINGTENINALDFIGPIMLVEYM